MRIDELAFSDYACLRWALDSGDPEAARAVLGRGRYVSSATRLGRLAQILLRRRSLEILLVACCANRDPDATRLLLRRGADPYASVGGYPPPIAAAAGVGALELCRLIVLEGPRGRSLSSALGAATLASQLAVVEFLLENGADPQFMLAADDGVLVRVTGRVLRALVKAGGTPSLAIRDLLAKKAALGDDDVPPPTGQ